MKQIALTALAVLLFALPAFAGDTETMFEWSGITDRKKAKAYHFGVDEKTKHTLSLSLAPSRDKARPFMRLRLYSVDDEGRETELKKYRIQIEKNQRLITDTITLKEPGRYAFRLEVSNADYMVKVERPKKDDD